MRGPRRGTAHQTGVPTLRHDGDAVVVAELHDPGDLLGIRGTHHRRSPPDPRTAPVGYERLLVVLVQDQALVTHDLTQGVENGSRYRSVRDGGIGRIGGKGCTRHLVLSSRIFVDSARRRRAGLRCCFPPFRALGFYTNMRPSLTGTYSCASDRRRLERSRERAQIAGPRPAAGSPGGPPFGPFPDSRFASSSDTSCGYGMD